jgi:hypothetical protein
VNYATFNPLQGGSDNTFSNGNRTVAAATTNWYWSGLTIAPTTGKYYCEFDVTTSGGVSRHMVGVILGTDPGSTTGQFRSTNDFYGYGYNNSSQYMHRHVGGTVTNLNPLIDWDNGDRAGLFIDCDNGQLWIAKNGTDLEGNSSAQTGATVTWPPGDYVVPSVGLYSGDSGTIYIDSSDWTYTPPTGYQALSAANLPDPTITDPGEHFNVVLYTGTQAVQSITGVGFQPDLVWSKNRGLTRRPNVRDVLRGATARLVTSDTNAEVTVSDGFTSFDSDGFSLGADGTYLEHNQNTYDHVAWNWKAGGAGVPNTDGTISSTVSVNDDAGFSIVKLASADATGASATLGHGLSAPPELIIGRPYSTTSSWPVYHKDNTSAPETDRLLLDTTGATVDDNRYWDDFVPTSTVFGVNSLSNISSQDSIFYCFRSIPGYSKVFSYTGNGSTDGTFVWLGFRPRWVVIKRSNSTSNWWTFDTVRREFNPTTHRLFTDLSNAEDTSTGLEMDIISCGLKLRNTNSNVNGGNYIGIAFAENPFGGSNLPLGLAQ